MAGNAVIASGARSAAAIAAALALAGGGCGGGGADAVGPGSPSGSRAWARTPASPLSGREGAVAVWTGTEVLVLGGSDARPCPPGAACVAASEPPLADGAAFDPRSRRWRAIAAAPVGFEWAQPLVLGGTVYLWVPGVPGRPGAARAFLAYDVAENRWRRLPVPAGAGDGYALTRFGRRLVLYSRSDEQRERPDFVFDAPTGSWRALPDDPLTRGFDRWLVGGAESVTLFDHELVANPGADGPIATRVARLRLGASGWRRLPDAVFSGSPWLAVGAHVVAPPAADTEREGGAADRGAVMDTRTGEWSALPRLPRNADTVVAGALTGNDASYLGAQGLVLDLGRRAWVELPAFDDGSSPVTGRAVVAAGRQVFVFGGARWDDPPRAVLLDDAWLWTP